MIESKELQTLIPHTGKMLLLSRVLDYDCKGSVRAEYDITENCLFYDPVINGVPAWVGFEFMAQTISALSGIRTRERGEKPKMGFILSVPSMQILTSVFSAGSSLEIRMNETDCTNLLYTYEGEILLNGEKVMEGKLMVMEINDAKQFQTLANGSAAN